ncbi:MAG TPA: ABC transporter permease [Spirochaetales bacterium]|nr:ABC transporter permease [Spirochaetales bacterium]
MTLSSLFFTARRWGFSSKRRASSNRAFLASLGIAVGVTALIVVMGVMGGLQNSYISSILEISSFHIRIETPNDNVVPQGDAGQTSDVDRILSRVRSLPGVVSAIPFKECQVLAVGPTGDPVSLTLRAMPKNTQELDQELVKALGLLNTDQFPRPNELAIGKEAALQLGAMEGEGSDVELMGVAQTQDEGVTTFSSQLTVGKEFSSGYYDFDSGMAFVSAPLPVGLERAFAATPTVIGIKLKNRFDDASMAEQIRQLLPNTGYALTTWREYNRGFFGALRTEKTVMLLLISLIFLVVAINVYHSLRRTIAMKQTDIATLKAVGASNRAIRGIFAQEGFSIGILGALLGSVLGVAVTRNLNSILGWMSAVAGTVSNILASLGLTNAGSYDLFSLQGYYLEKIPVDISVGEIAFIACLAIASTAISAILASRRVSDAIPFEVLRNE